MVNGVKPIIKRQVIQEFPREISAPVDVILVMSTAVMLQQIHGDNRPLRKKMREPNAKRKFGWVHDQKGRL
tara:strand:+ start:4385 stop:4597 length:213 start_codon:yes stop_codon:yes gene_type:complete